MLSARLAGEQPPAPAVEHVKLWGLFHHTKVPGEPRDHLWDVFDTRRAAQRSRGEQSGLGMGDTFIVRPIAATFGGFRFWTLSSWKWERALDAESLLDRPRDLKAGAEWFYPAGFKMSREEALEDAAETNLETLRDFHAKRNEDWLQWAVVVEIGSLDIASLWSGDITRGSRTGKLETHQEYAMRLVDPTDEERARYPVPSELLTKGGAA